VIEWCFAAEQVIAISHIRCTHAIRIHKKDGDCAPGTPASSGAALGPTGAPAPSAGPARQCAPASVLAQLRSIRQQPAGQAALSTHIAPFMVRPALFSSPHASTYFTPAVPAGSACFRLCCSCSSHVYTHLLCMRHWSADEALHRVGHLHLHGSIAMPG